MDAESVRECMGAPIIIMTSSSVQQELETIRESLPERHGQHDRKPGNEELWLCVMRFQSLTEPCIEPPTVSELRGVLAPLRETESRVLSLHLNQIEKALWHARHYHGRDYDASDLLAVPNVWHRRWESLLGGRIFPCWIAPVDPASFHP